MASGETAAIENSDDPADMEKQRLGFAVLYCTTNPSRCHIRPPKI